MALGKGHRVIGENEIATSGQPGRSGRPGQSESNAWREVGTGYETTGIDPKAVPNHRNRACVELLDRAG